MWTLPAGLIGGWQMRGLRILMLGRPLLELDGQPLAAAIPLKQQALVYYVALADGPVPRSELAALLWPDLAANAARANLRTALMQLRRTLPGVLCVDGGHVALSATQPVESDLAILLDAATGQCGGDARDAAVAAWRGDFLEGFEAPGDAFEEWLAAARLRIRAQVLGLRRALAREAEAGGCTEQALAHCYSLLAIDDADEAAHMAVMRLLVAAGRRTAALSQYETCRAALAARLGAKPSAACYALYVRIHADRGVVDGPDSIVSGIDTTHPNGAVVSLVGRETELALLQERLSDPECRWLTVTGPGGVGKTHLARAAAELMQARHGLDVLWLSGRDPGGPLRHPDLLARQVHERLAKGQGRVGLLLVLDNLELLAEAGALARALHERARAVRVLATSRRWLGVPREWLLELPGLSLIRGVPGRAGTSPAAMLLLRSISRLDPAFDHASNVLAIEALCARVGGLPLALKLAARSIAQTGIDSALERLDAASLPVDDEECGQVPRRLASILEESWSALPVPARRAAMTLAALPERFDAALAAAVDVTPAELVVLREHAWLVRSEDRLLAFHPLQLDYLRRREGGEAGGHVRVRDAVVDHVLRRLPVAAIPFALVRCPALEAGVAPETETATFAADVLKLVLARLMAAGAVESLARFMDGVVPMLCETDRSEEAAGMLAVAVSTPGLPVWLTAAWTLQQARILNQLGDWLRGQQRFEAGFALLGLDDAETHPGVLHGLGAALARIWFRTGWPPRGPTRRGFELLLLNALADCTQLVTLTPQPQRALRYNLLCSTLARRTGLRQNRYVADLLLAYGMASMGFGRLARARLQSLRSRSSVPDPGLELFAQQGECVTRMVLGDWAGIDERLAMLADAFEERAEYRRAMECLSLAAKLRFYQGHLIAARAGFIATTERGQRHPGGVWRAWGPVGEAEVALCLGDRSDEALAELVAVGAHWLSEMQNMDSAYVFRRFGLIARIALRVGDRDRAREAVLAGAAAAARMRIFGFWAHEGLAGLCDTLLALHRHERTVGGALPPLDAAWCALQSAVRRHARVFAPAAALHARLEGERLLDDGDPGAGAMLMRATTLAERYGMRVELARACDALARHNIDPVWARRAALLWADMLQIAGPGSR